MGLTELLFIAVGLSMDAFAVSMGFGITTHGGVVKKSLVTALYFGGFQAGMPLAGYYAAAWLAGRISAFDHWIALVLLCFIGGKMIAESRKKGDAGPGPEISLTPGTMLPLALATSVDALSAGVSFAFLRVDILPAVLLIGSTTFVISMAGVKIGRLFGTRFKSKAELAGGLVLILIGVKIWLEHILWTS